MLAAPSAHGAEDRFDRSKFGGLGGFQPVKDDTYRKECGACHFAYLPGFLPARSWNRVLDDLKQHFGESIELSPDVGAHLRQYLTANAADKVQDKGPAVFLERLKPEQTPVRVTQLLVMIRKHAIVREVMKVNATTPARSITNCNVCHQRAIDGSFALEDLLVPGVSKVVKPGGLF